MANLFDEFAKVNYEEWIEKASRDLKGIDPIEAFQVQLSESILQKPYYDESSRSFPEINISGLKAVREFDPWYNTQKITFTDSLKANKIALKSLESGSNGISFESKTDTADLHLLFKNISLQYIWTSLKGVSAESATSFLHETVSPDDYKKVQFAIVTPDQQIKENSDLQSIINTVQTLERFENAKCISLALKEDNTKNVTTQIALMLSQFVEIASCQDKISIFELFNRTIILNSISNQYFFEICKLRAIRILFHEVARSYKVSDAKIFIQSETRRDEDELQMLLSNTTQSMSAIIGGTDSLVVKSNEMEATNHSLRISRNISSLLAEEGRLDKINDPAAGSYFLDNLTKTIVEESWSKFLELEANGGFLNNIKN